MGNIQNIIKKVRNIMRKDAGVGGDEQRLTQIVWMLFLKIFDDKEKELELISKNYKSPLPEEFRWRNWGADPEGITGEELFTFIDKELFPALRNISIADDNKYSIAIKTIFTDTHNYLKSGVHIRQVCIELNKIDFNKKSDRDLLGDIYEHLLNEMAAALNKGEYYTPRPITKFTAEMLKPQLNEKILDPACGTGGFLLSAIDYMSEKQVKSQSQKRQMIKNIQGVELKALPHLLATTNMILHDVDDPSVIRRDDMLARPLIDYGPSDRVDVIIANPPFSGEIVDGTENNFPKRFKTKSTALLFLVLFIKLLKNNGRAGVVLPDGVLFGEGVETEIKKELLETCNLHTIIRLPKKSFLYAGARTNLLFFDKTGPTKEVWCYQMKLPQGFKSYNKSRPIKNEDFDEVKKWWGRRKVTDQAWKVSIEEIEKHNYNLDFKNPNGGTKVEHKEPEEIIVDVEGAEKQIVKLLGEIKKEL